MVAWKVDLWAAWKDFWMVEKMVEKMDALWVYYEACLMVDEMVA